MSATMNEYRCRVCSSPRHEVVLDYGEVALADSFLRADAQLADEPRYPLTLVACEECLHIQIKEVLDPSLLFSDYVWETGIPASIHDYCTQFIDAVSARLTRTESKRIVEIASNDGTMLKAWKARGYTVQGVDPARNIAEKANAAGIPTRADFFTKSVAEELVAHSGQVDVCVARNVIAHVADLHGLVAGIRVLLRKGGTAVVEFPHLLTTYRELQYDQVFHEHVGYHSLDSLLRLAAMHDLEVIDVDHAWIHGGSLRVYLSRADDGRVAAAAVQQALAEERAEGVLDMAAWRSFGDKVREQRKQLREELGQLRAAGKKVVGYGASGKGQSMIQFCQLGPDDVAFIADKSTMKIGKLAPGSHIPVVSPETMREYRPDVVVLFAWNFAKEIASQEKQLADSGTRFLHPLPSPHYL